MPSIRLPLQQTVLMARALRKLTNPNVGSWSSGNVLLQVTERPPEGFVDIRAYAAGLSSHATYVIGEQINGELPAGTWIITPDILRWLAELRYKALPEWNGRVLQPGAAYRIMLEHHPTDPVAILASLLHVRSGTTMHTMKGEEHSGAFPLESVQASLQNPRLGDAFAVVDPLVLQDILAFATTNLKKMVGGRPEMPPLNIATQHDGNISVAIGRLRAVIAAR